MGKEQIKNLHESFPEKKKQQKIKNIQILRNNLPLKIYGKKLNLLYICAESFVHFTVKKRKKRIAIHTTHENNLNKLQSGFVKFKSVLHTIAFFPDVNQLFYNCLDPKDMEFLMLTCSDFHPSKIIPQLQTLTISHNQLSFLNYLTNTTTISSSLPTTTSTGIVKNNVRKIRFKVQKNTSNSGEQKHEVITKYFASNTRNFTKIKV